MGGFLGILVLLGFIMSFLSGSLGDGFRFAGIFGIIVVVIFLISNSGDPTAALFIALALFWLIYYFLERKNK